MTKEEVVSIFSDKPYLLRMGANKIAKQLKCDPEIVRSAKSVFRNVDSRFVDNKKCSIENKLKVLFLDVETSPMIGYFWKRWKENLGLDQTISEWFIISWSAKWANDDKIINGVLTPKEAVDEDDYRIMIDLWNLLNQADVVVTHNGIRFDHKKINTRFILNGLPPTRPFRVIDTLKMIKDSFAFSSNKLDNILIQFGLERKLDTNFNLWKDCMHGNQNALLKMSEYNDWDVIQLEKAFIRLRPWVKNFPNFVLYNDIDNPEICPMCGSNHLISDGMYTTSTNRYQLYRCGSCGSMSRARKADKIKILITNNLR